MTGPVLDEPFARQLVEDTEEQLRRWRTPDGGDPAQERRRLMMLALEREQLVSVAYDEAVIARRASALPVPPEVRELIRHALIWAWKDEELHAAYVRGRLLRQQAGSWPVFARQAYGAVAGWVTATRHHLLFGESRGRVGLAAAMVVGGRFTRRIPRSLTSQLSYQTFSHYCALNVALEWSAERCYARLVELAVDEGERVSFQRIQGDERRHRHMFQVLAETLTETGSLREGADAGSLRTALADISQWFLPATCREGSTADTRVATGADVHVAERPAPEPAALVPMLSQLLDEAGLASLVRESGGRVAVRTTFMFGYSKNDMSTVASPEVVRALATYLRRCGAADVAVLETPTVYDSMYAHRDVAAVARYFGFEPGPGDGYRLVDIGQDQDTADFDRGLAQATVSRTWRDADVRIVLGKLRTDPRQGGYLAMSTLVGMGERVDQTMHADREIDHESAVMMVLDTYPPHFALVDAWGPVGTGAFGCMASSRPVCLSRVYAGRDPVSVDWQVLSDMGVRDPSAMPILRLSQHWFGGDARPRAVHGDVGPIGADLRLPADNAVRRLMARLSFPVYIYASRHGQLFVPEMDQAAFPPLHRPGPGTRLVRAITQRVFGLHPPR